MTANAGLIMELLQIIYTSQLRNRSPGELQKIIDTSRKHNEAAGVTGMLLVADELVLQLLEGTQAEVENTYRCILSDVRHTNVLELGRTTVTKREFADWTMGLRTLHANDVDTLRHYFGIFSGRSSVAEAQTKLALAREVLESFSAWTMDAA
jgi:hypothetical protein